MKTIKYGSKGKQVSAWQFFLIGEGHLIQADGHFGKQTKLATIKFQKKHKLTADGIVGNRTYAAAMMIGMPVVESDSTGTGGPNWPQKPSFKPLTSTAERQKLFGKFSYKHTPTAKNKEKITVTDDWVKQNIVYVDLPQLSKAFKGKYTRMRFHKLAANQLKALWAEWEARGLLHHVISYEGAYTARLVRGSTKTLSNHAFGTAFDINARYNGLGKMPALKGEKGSVRELVKIANKHGFYWGGHFSRGDGMHFEVAVLK